MRSVCTRQVGQPEGVGSLLPGMYLNPGALEMEAPPHLLSSPGQWVGSPSLGTHCPPVTGQTLSLGCPPALLSGPPPPPISPAPFPEGTVLSPKPAPSCTLVPSPPHAVLTSSQVPRDEAEEDADDVTQVRFAAMLALLQPQGRVPSWARGLPAPRHPWTRPRDPSFWPTGHSASPPASLSPLCLPLPNRKALRASVLEPSLPPLSPNLSASPVGLGRPSVSASPPCPALLSALSSPPPLSAFRRTACPPAQPFTLRLTLASQDLGAPSPWRQKGSCSFLGWEGVRAGWALFLSSATPGGGAPA